MKFLLNILSGPLPFTMLLTVGFIIAFKYKFFQITKFPESILLTAKAFKSQKKTEEVTSFKSACTALSATVGTGNIAGVAGAISIGGAGAVFWMWVSAILGMGIKGFEISLAILYREKKGNSFVGGPMYYIKNGLNKAFSPLGIIFCLFSIPAIFCSGNITQTNSAVLTFCNTLPQKTVVGLIFAIFCFLAIKGGIKRVANLTEKIVPLMSIIYILLSLWVIFKNINTIPDCFKMIIEGAFNPKAVTGGAVGSITICIFTGSSRGVFSNEAGLGTSAMAHSVAEDADYKTQGLFGIFEVFVDTILLCTLTALTILCSGVKISYGQNASTELVLKALNLNVGNFAAPLLSVMMCLFGFSSIIGWAVYGKLCMEYIFGEKGIKLFNIIYPLTCIFGAVVTGNSAWELASVSSGIMLCVNLMAILLFIRKSEMRNCNDRKIKNSRLCFRRKYRSSNFK